MYILVLLCSYSCIWEAASCSDLTLRWLDPPPYNTKFRSPGCRTGDLYVYKGARKAMETGLRSAIGPQEV